MGKPYLLFVSSHLPADKIPEAGQKIARAILMDYAKEYELVLISFANQAEMPYYQASDFDFCRETHIIPVNQKSRLLNLLQHPYLPINTAIRADRRVSSLIKKLKLKYTFHMIYLEYTACAYYLDLFTGNEIRVVNEQDVTYQSLERKKKLAKGIKKIFYSLEYLHQKFWELSTLRKADKIMVFNSKDLQLLVQDGVNPEKISIIRPAVHPMFTQVRRDRFIKNSLLFWGALNRNENSDAVVWFVSSILPLIKIKIPDVKLYIVGANPPENILALKSESIHITGFVENPVPYFEMAEVAIVPLRLGAGIKIKVLECLAAGLTVITTAVGAEGIGEQDRLVVADNPQEFSRKVVEALN